MAFLYVAEFSKIAGIGTTLAQIVPMPPITEQKIAIGGASAASAAFNAATTIIRVETDAICSIAVAGPPSSNPAVATVANMRMDVGTVEYFAVPAGGTIAVITNT